MRFLTCTHDAYAQAILDIFNEAIVNSTALYDYNPRSLETMAGWFNAKQADNFPVIGVTAEDETLLGFASYATFRPWPAYKYSVEHSVYVHSDHRGKGVGFALMQELIAVAIEQQYHVMIGGIDITNAASIALHEKLGFVHAGTIKQAGFKFNRWLDLGFYQRILKTPREPIDG